MFPRDSVPVVFSRSKERRTKRFISPMHPSVDIVEIYSDEQPKGRGRSVLSSPAGEKRA